MKRIHRTGAIGVAHELVDVAAPGFLRIITGCWLERSKDGREEGRGWGRDAPVAFSKAGKDENNPVNKCRPILSRVASALALPLARPLLPLRLLRGLSSPSPSFDILF